MLIEPGGSPIIFSLSLISFSSMIPFTCLTVSGAIYFFNPSTVLLKDFGEQENTYISDFDRWFQFYFLVLPWKRVWLCTYINYALYLRTSPKIWSSIAQVVLVFIHLGRIRHPHLSIQVLYRTGDVTTLQLSLYATTWYVACTSHKCFYFRAFIHPSHLKQMSDIATQANSLFLRLNFHQQVSLCYWLHPIRVTWTFPVSVNGYS